jgi:hypothetical protein
MHCDKAYRHSNPTPATHFVVTEDGEQFAYCIPCLVFDTRLQPNDIVAPLHPYRAGRGCGRVVNGLTLDNSRAPFIARLLSNGWVEVAHLELYRKADREVCISNDGHRHWHATFRRVSF